MSRRTPARILVVAVGAAALVSGCAGLSNHGSSNRHERRYVNDFCEAHAMVGVVREVNLALGVMSRDYAAISMQGSRLTTNLHQQELRGYSTSWQHLHQSMNTACRDLATCRYRTSTAAAPECDVLRSRLDEVVARGQHFLLRLRDRETADGAAHPGGSLIR